MESATPRSPIERAFPADRTGNVLFIGDRVTVRETGQSYEIEWFPTISTVWLKGMTFSIGCDEVDFLSRPPTVAGGQ